MNQKKPLACVCVTGIMCVSAARADVVVGSFDLTDAGGPSALFDTLPVAFGMQNDFIQDPEGFVLFGGGEVGAADVGTVWTSSSAEMDAMRAWLQDDNEFDLVGLTTEITLANGSVFGYFYGVAELSFPFYGLDLETVATQADELRVTLLSFSAVSPGDDPNQDGVWTDYEMSYRFEFVSVPGPGAMATLAFGATALGRRRR